MNYLDKKLYTLLTLEKPSAFWWPPFRDLFMSLKVSGESKIYICFKKRLISYLILALICALQNQAWALSPTEIEQPKGLQYE